MQAADASRDASPRWTSATNAATTHTTTLTSPPSGHATITVLRAVAAVAKRRAVFCRKTRMSASLKIGLMGYGFAGATFHAPVIAALRARERRRHRDESARARAGRLSARESRRRSRRAARARRHRLRRDRDAQRHALRPRAPHARSRQARGGRQAGHAERRRRPHARQHRARPRQAVRAVSQPSLGRRFPDRARSARPRANWGASRNSNRTSTASGRKCGSVGAKRRRAAAACCSTSGRI